MLPTCFFFISASLRTEKCCEEDILFNSNRKEMCNLFCSKTELECSEQILIDSHPERHRYICFSLQL